MRPVALGRKNRLHIGNPQGGPKVAAILSLVESCRRLQVPVRDYSVSVRRNSCVVSDARKRPEWTALTSGIGHFSVQMLDQVR